jgi:hypothetical protein
VIGRNHLCSFGLRAHVKSGFGCFEWHPGATGGSISRWRGAQRELKSNVAPSNSRLPHTYETIALVQLPQNRHQSFHRAGLRQGYLAQIFDAQS